MEALLSRLSRGDVIVGDGAWGTELFARGLPLGQPPESWTLEQPEVIGAIARDYMDAGAEIITTNTFGGSPARLRQHGLADRMQEINTQGVALARDVARERAYVSASVGPTGLLLRPVGDADPVDVADGFARQIAALASAGVDIICIETMTDLREAILAVEAARRGAPGTAVIATMTFDRTPRGPFTIMGVSVAEAARGLERAGADVVGANCGTGVEAMIAVSDEFSRHTGLPIAVRPNAGNPERRGSRLVYPDTPERFGEAAATFADQGVRIIGGCCGTTPAHIRALRAAIARRRG